jgi:hypothetical protein
MTAAGRSRLLLVFASLLLGVVVSVAAGGPVSGQTNTTAPAVTAAAAAPSTTAATAGDEGSTRTVNRIVAVLIGLAIVLVGVAIWFWRATKPTPRHLDALDMMGTRRWREGGPGERSVLLAPVHERRAEALDEVAEPEPVAAVTPVAPAASVLAPDEVEDVNDAEEEPTPRAS